jgi:hypothetical protein
MNRWEVGGLLGEFINKMKKECPGIIIDLREESVFKMDICTPTLIIKNQLNRGELIMVPHFDNTLYYDAVTKRVAEFFNAVDCI